MSQQDMIFIILQQTKFDSADKSGENHHNQTKATYF